MSASGGLIGGRPSWGSMRAGTLSRSSLFSLPAAMRCLYRRAAHAGPTETGAVLAAWHGHKRRIQDHLEGKSSANDHRRAAVREKRWGINKE
jgi:hypothetical protein